MPNQQELTKKEIHMTKKTRNRRSQTMKAIDKMDAPSEVVCKSLGINYPPPKNWRDILKGKVSPKQDTPKRAKTHRTPKGKRGGFYSSWEWKAARYEALKMHGRRCQCCGWRPGDTEHGHLVVDHIKPRSKHPELSLSVENLQVMCNDCNMGKSNIWEDDFRDVEDWFSNIMREI